MLSLNRISSRAVALAVLLDAQLGESLMGKNFRHDEADSGQGVGPLFDALAHRTQGAAIASLTQATAQPLYPAASVPQTAAASAQPNQLFAALTSHTATSAPAAQTAVTPTPMASVAPLADSAAVASSAAAAMTSQVQASVAGTKPSTPKLTSPLASDAKAQKLQDSSARGQDHLVDSLENAEVSEVKRVMFRALSRMRAAQIQDYDAIAWKQNDAVYDFNKDFNFRKKYGVNYTMGDDGARMPKFAKGDKPPWRIGRRPKFSVKPHTTGKIVNGKCSCPKQSLGLMQLGSSEEDTGEYAAADAWGVPSFSWLMHLKTESEAAAAATSSQTSEGGACSCGPS